MNNPNLTLCWNCSREYNNRFDKACPHCGSANANQNLDLAAYQQRHSADLAAARERIARLEGALRRIEYKLSARNPETQVKANEALWLLLFSDIQKITRAALVSKEQP